MSDRQEYWVYFGIVSVLILFFFMETALNPIEALLFLVILMFYLRMGAAEQRLRYDNKGIYKDFK